MRQFRGHGCLFVCLASVLLLCWLSAGCDRSQPEQRAHSATKKGSRTTRLQVAFEWTAENRCSDRSPEIVVEGIPAGTARLDVTMTDMDMKSYPHGGGSVECNQKGRMVIPAGALGDYKGPCPPGAPHRYRIVVSCVSESGRISASGEALRTCCN